MRKITTPSIPELLERIKFLERMIGQADKSVHQDLEQVYQLAVDRNDEIRLARAFLSTPLGMWDYNLVTKETVHNEQYATMLGYKLSELPKGKACWPGLVHADDRADILKKHAHAIKCGTDYRLEFRMKCKDGSYRWIRSLGIVVERNKHGKPIRIIGTHRDITDLKMMQQQLNLVSAAAEQAPALILLLDSTGSVVYFNKMFATVFHRHLTDWRGRSFRDLFSNETNQVTITEAIKRIDHGKITRTRLTLVADDTHANPMTIDVLAARMVSNGTNFYHLIGRDTTRESDLQEQLLNAERWSTTGKLSASMVHDINNILQVILAEGERLMLTNSNQTSSPFEIGRNIVVATEQASRFAKQLLTMNSVTQLSAHVVDFRELLDDLLPVLNRIVSKKAKLLIKSTDSPCMVKCNTSKMMQVILNLVTNGVEAIDDKGEIAIELAIRMGRKQTCQVATERRTRYVVVSVHDTGKGMDASTIQRAFNPHFTTKELGYGIGLLTVKIAVEELHGYVRVTSAVNRGTTFEIGLPFAAQASSKTTGKPATRRKVKPK